MPGSNYFLDAGNVSVAAPYVIAGKTGVLTARSAGDPLFTLVNLGRLFEGVLKSVPLYVSQVRMKYIPTTAGTSACAFEIHECLVTAQRTTGTAAKTVTPTNRKRNTYPTIPATEVNAWVAGTDATGGGTIVIDDTNSPFDMTDGGAGTLELGSTSIWRPMDMVPLTIEQGRGMEVRAAQHDGTGILYVAVDFLRQ